MIDGCWSGFSEHPSGRELKKSFRYTKLKNSERFANQAGLVDAVCWVVVEAAVVVIYFVCNPGVVHGGQGLDVA